MTVFINRKHEQNEFLCKPFVKIMFVNWRVEKLRAIGFMTIRIEICSACVLWMRPGEYLLLVHFGFRVLTGKRRLFKCIQNYSIASVFCGSAGNKEKIWTVQNESLFHEHSKTLFVTVFNLYMTKRKTVTLKQFTSENSRLGNVVNYSS